MDKQKYKRVLLKISGEALAGAPGRGHDFGFIHQVCDAIMACARQGVEVGLVVGGGNIWRGLKDGGDKMERSRADQMGMLATVINSLAVQDVLEQKGQEARVLTSFEMGPVAQRYTYADADRYLKEGKVVIFAGGTGNPYFSTDTAAVLRAAEIDADMILLAKNIDGVYSADPRKDPDAVRYDRISYAQVLADGLQVMDLPATALAMENHIPVMIFALADPENILRAVRGESIGTIVEEEMKHV
ncbi:MAG: UMP kinase [Bacillota bacterium]|nr:UMP kinase [Bacillota bacterium]